jgi:flagellar biosynthesis protein FliP
MDRSAQQIKLTEVRQFLMENPTESKAVAVRIFEINVNTLITFMHRQFKKHENEQIQHEGQNKILKEHEEKSMHRLIESLLTHEMLPTFNVVFSDIVALKLAQNVIASSES